MLGQGLSVIDQVLGEWRCGAVMGSGGNASAAVLKMDWPRLCVGSGCPFDNRTFISRVVNGPKRREKPRRRLRRAAARKRLADVRPDRITSSKRPARVGQTTGRLPSGAPISSSWAWTR